MRFLLTCLLLGSVLTRHAEAQTTQLLYLAEDVPVSIDPDGPSSTVNTSQIARMNMMDPLFGYAMKGPNEDGIRIPDFTKFEGRLAESWEFDAPTLTWTIHLRHGVIGCSGNEMTAADVLYTFARAKSVSGATTYRLVLQLRRRDQGLQCRRVQAGPRTSRSGMRWSRSIPTR